MATGKQQRTALVTGSSNGIGEAIARQLAQLDYKLVITGRNEDDIKRVAEKCASLSPSGSKPLEVKADLGREEDVESLFKDSMHFFGNKLHVLVNNAGLGRPIEHSKADECYSAFKHVMQVNLNATVRLTLLCAPILKATAERESETTSIVNIGSIASLRPGQSLFAYGTSKAAMNMFTDCMAVELAPLVRVNCVSPGPIETKIIERSGFSLEAFKQIAGSVAPLKRMGSADEVAQSVLFLADHQRAAYITGANLVIDGGVVKAPMRYQ